MTMRYRVSIAALMVLVLFLAIGFAALRSGSDWWASATFSATLLALALAAPLAVYRRGPRRAFWAWFAAFGAAYLVLVFTPWFESAIRPRLLTTKGIDALHAAL